MRDQGEKGNKPWANDKKKSFRDDRGGKFVQKESVKESTGEKKGNKSAKQRARDAERLLKKAGENLSEEAKTHLQGRVEYFTQRKKDTKKKEKKEYYTRQALNEKKEFYNEIKFIETKKIKRKMTQVRTRIMDAMKRLEEIQNLIDEEDVKEKTTLETNLEVDRAKLQDLQMDLLYIEKYPSDQKYVSLFPTGGDSEEMKTQRDKIRQKILDSMLDGEGENKMQKKKNKKEQDYFFKSVEE